MDPQPSCRNHMDLGLSLAVRKHLKCKNKLPLTAFLQEYIGDIVEL